MSSLLARLYNSLNNGLYYGPLGSAMKSVVLSDNKRDPNTTLLLNFENGWSDSSPNELPIIPFGAAAISTFSKFGSGSGSFLNSTDVIRINETPILGLRNNNFTIEAWIFKSSAITNYNGIFEIGTGASPFQNGIMMRMQTAAPLDTLYIANTYYNWDPSANFPIGRWNHLALVRNGDNFTVYINGRSVLSIARSVNLGSTSLMTIGNNAHTGGTSQALLGFIDSFRISNGFARYTSNFAPPERAFK